MIATPKTYPEVVVLTDRAVQLAQGIVEEMGAEGGWNGFNLECAREQTAELRNILAALWRWAK